MPTSEAHRKAAQRYYLKNRDRIRQHSKDYVASLSPEQKDKARDARRANYAKNKEHLNATRREYRRKNKDRIAAQKKKSDQAHRDRINAYVRKWSAPRRVELNARHRENKWRLKCLTFSAYGGVCVCCGEADPRFLTIDHIGNDGAESRRKNGYGSGDKLYRWLRKNDFPKNNYQVMCFNCNCAKAHYGVCPHQMSAVADDGASI